MSAPASSSPPTIPSQRGGTFAAFRRTNGIMNASNGDLESVVASGELLASWCAILIVCALVAAAVLVFVPLSQLGTKIATFVENSLVAIGVFGELFFHKRSSLAQGEISDRLRRQLARRTVTAKQYREIQTLRGKLAAVSVAYVADSDSQGLAILLDVALSRAGIRVAEYKLPPGMYDAGEGIMVYDPLAFENPDGEPTNGEPLASLLTRAKLAPGALVIGRLPEGAGLPPEIPALIVMKKYGGPFVEPAFFEASAELGLG